MDAQTEVEIMRLTKAIIEGEIADNLFAQECERVGLRPEIALDSSPLLAIVTAEAVDRA